tara:strand:+ start:53380 stop:54003 length:624 start_codon:yes stop_codon:yes gene_type:complete
MNVLEYLEQEKYKKEFLRDKLLTKVLKESQVSYDHHDDAKQEVMMSWLLNDVKGDYSGDVKSVVSFAFKIGQQACYGYKRNMTGALRIPRRVIKEHREKGEKLVTDMVDITIVKENEVNDTVDGDVVRNFELPVQGSLYTLPKIDQNIEKDLNEGESLANVEFSSGYEKRALQSKLVNLTKANEIYVKIIQEELEGDVDIGEQFSIY